MIKRNFEWFVYLCEDIVMYLLFTFCVSIRAIIRSTCSSVKLHLVSSQNIFWIFFISLITFGKHKRLRGFHWPTAQKLLTHQQVAQGLFMIHTVGMEPQTTSDGGAEKCWTCWCLCSCVSYCVNNKMSIYPYISTQTKESAWTEKSDCKYKLVSIIHHKS